MMLALTGIAVLCYGCGGAEQKSSDMEKRQRAIGETYVDTMTLRTSDFNRQIVCNGRLRARAKSDLSFTQQGITSEICVREGMHVDKGVLIASLDKRERLREVEKAERELQRAQVELADKLIGLGYGNDSSLFSLHPSLQGGAGGRLSPFPSGEGRGEAEEVMRRAEVTSGYYSARYQLQSARTMLAECDLYAPFSGRIANLEARTFQRNDKVCTLIDDSQFDVEFKVLEAEYENVRKGRPVRIAPFVADSMQYDGVVTAINPLVDDKGLIKVTARLDNSGGTLIDGMNVRVIIEDEVKNLFVVPKDAVVERDGYHVIFLYQDGQAVWTYVDVLHSNISSFAITGCRRKETSIHEGDIIITSGNLNLADGTEVKLNQ